LEIGEKKLATKTEVQLEDFDFGFSAVDENELAAVTTATAKVATASGNAEAVQAKMDKMFNAVMPLLNNLQKNPGKEYIFWPDRHNKVEQFRDKLTILYKS
jgi:hypothetical protein|tara:strand:- start:157 stop:459 length:303 start_codon:yes stop_codon:yes gene_type:complete